MTIDNLVAGLGLRHFSVREVTSYFRRPLNADPAPVLWDNGRRVLLLADEFRERFGSPIRLTSTYRAPAYNQSVGGSPKSQHMRFAAADLSPVNGDVNRLYAVIRDARDVGTVGITDEYGNTIEVIPFRGGIGRYASFIHFDIRGRNVDWGRSSV